jgi:hypothetical protein
MVHRSWLYPRKANTRLKSSAWSQLHQHFTSSFFVQKFHTQLFLYLHFRFVLSLRKNIGANAAHKMLVKLTPALHPAGENLKLHRKPKRIRKRKAYPRFFLKG